MLLPSITGIPSDIVNTFLPLLDGRSLARLGSTCRHLRDQINKAQDIWRKLSIGDSEPPFKVLDWKAYYAKRALIKRNVQTRNFDQGMHTQLEMCAKDIREGRNRNLDPKRCWRGLWCKEGENSFTLVGKQIIVVDSPGCKKVLCYAQPGEKFEQIAVDGNRLVVQTREAIKIFNITNSSVMHRFNADSFEVIDHLIYLKTEENVEIYDLFDFAKLAAIPRKFQTLGYGFDGWLCHFYDGKITMSDGSYTQVYDLFLPLNSMYANYISNSCNKLSFCTDRFLKMYNSWMR